MLAGRYEAKLGKKFQISFPKKFRNEMGDKLILTKGLDENLIIVSEKKWETLLEGTKGLPFTNKNARELQRFLLGNVFELEIDGKGRFLIPEFLRDYAHLKEDVVFLGIDRFVELWSSDIWEKYQKDLSLRVESIAEKLQSKDLGDDSK